MSKPIQDRIYRSRLTIKYRTTIDGVPVPQTLPLRLLVLGDFSGIKIPEGQVVPNARRLENRRIVSIKRGAPIDKVIDEMDVSFRVPDDDNSKVLSNTARLSGAYQGTVSGLLADVNEEGACPVEINGWSPGPRDAQDSVTFEGEIYDNGVRKFSGPLHARGTVLFTGKVNPAAEVVLKGSYAVPVIAGTNTATFALAKNATSGAWEVTLGGEFGVKRADATGVDFVKAALTDVVSGTVESSDNVTGRWNGEKEITLKVSDQKSYNLKVSAYVPVKNNAPPGINAKTIELTATDDATGEGGSKVPVKGQSLGSVEIDNATVDAAAKKITVPLKGRLKDKVPGKISGTLEFTSTTDIAVGGDGYDVAGEIEVATSDGKYKIPVKGKVTCVPGGPEWVIADNAGDKPALTLLDGNKVSVRVQTQGETIESLFGINDGVVKAGKAGDITLKPTSETHSLVNQDGEPEFYADGKLEGAISASLGDLAGKTIGGAKLDAIGDLQFTNNNQAGGSCKIYQTSDPPKVTVTFDPPKVTLSAYGKLRGEQGADSLAQGSADFETTEADVTKSSLVTIEQRGEKLAVMVNLAKVAGSATRSVPIQNLDSFSPDAISQNVPEIRRLQAVVTLLQELKTDINLSTDLRDAFGNSLRSMLEPKTGESHAEEVKSALAKLYPAFKLDVDAALFREPDANGTPLLQATVKDPWFAKNYGNIADKLIKASEIVPSKDKKANDKPKALVAVHNGSLEFYDRDMSKERGLRDDERFLNAVAAFLINAESPETCTNGQIAKKIDDVIEAADAKVKNHLLNILQNGDFRTLERNWRSVDELVKQVETDQAIVDLLDVSYEDLREDLADHSSDIFTSHLFKKIYVDEYDRYGGKPFGGMIGLYEFTNRDEDMAFLETMSLIANAAHCPFVSSVAPKFFGEDMEKWSDLDTIGDIEAHLNLPKFGRWNALRDTPEAPYIGLTMPGYLMRQPWTADKNQLGNRKIKLDEGTSDYLWGNCAVLMGRNIIRSFENSGWCQYIRGVKGGGLIQGLVVHTIKRHDQEETQPPVEIEIADYRELQFSKAGLIPLVHCKGTADAAFFSAQSIKKPRDFRSELDTQNAYLVTNLAYTFSITRIAHYVKRMMRDYIGSTADPAYIQNVLSLWLTDYVTTTVNPDDLTLRYFPFKAVSVTVEPKPGPLGWYKAVISILPHIQFEGMDVELRLEAALGGK